MTSRLSSVPSNRLSVPAIPAVAGKYRLIFELGRGGMADVMLAVIQGPGGFNKLQVLKLLRQELATEPEFCTMFLEEARLSARINHPNVAQTNEVGFDGERYFIAMEYLEGQSLDDLMRRARTVGVPVPVPLVLRTLADACAGLHFAHELKDFDGTPLHVIHRDVSPQNVFVTYDGITKLLDFGIAKASDSKIRTQAGTIKGKIAYMPPEQLMGQGHVDRRADIFSVGAVLWRTITGKRMWGTATEMEILQSLANRKIPEPVPLPGIPDELVEICKKALAPHPNDRYPTAAALRSDIEMLLATLPGGSHAEVASFVNGLFAERRREIATAIDARLSSPETPLVSATRSLPRLQPPSTGSLATTGSTQVGGAFDGGGLIGETSGVTSGAPSAGRGWKIAAGVLLAFGVVAAGLLARGNSTPAPAAVSTPPPPVPQPPLAEKKELTDVVFDVNPASARVFIDDVTLTGRPPHGAFPRDGREHRVRVQAEGYITKTQDVVFDIESVRLELSLEKERAASAPPAWRPPSNKGRTLGATASPPPALAPALPTVAVTPAEPPPPPLHKPAASKSPRSGMESLDKEDPWKK